MGIYDRDYYRGEQRSFSWAGPRTVVGTLILINVVVYLVNAIFTPPKDAVGLGSITSFLAVDVQTLTQPLYWWRFLTYGFVHVYQPQHILWNMLGLWFLGQDVEAAYGRKQFLRFYLVALVVGSVAWAVANRLAGAPGLSSLVGASGAVTAVVILFSLTFPHRTVLLFLLLPVPAWFVGVLFVAGDVYQAMGHGSPRIAWGVHLAGAAFALAYFYFKWDFSRLLPGRLDFSWLKPRPRFHVYDPDESEDDDGDLSAEVDRILEKISREGEISLSRKERRTLETASREYQRRQRQSDPNRR